MIKEDKSESRVRIDELNTPPVVTIDGISGSGKGTISLLLANKLGWHYLDSGALYRTLAYYAYEIFSSVNPTSDFSIADIDKIMQQFSIEKLVELAAILPVEFKQGEKNQPVEIYLNGKLITKQVRSENFGLAASKIATISEIRAALLARQRAFLQWPGLVADGRDMGTFVFPQAKIKVFLQASVAIRAERRYQQLKNMGLDGNLERLMGDIARRDEQDRNRVVAPTKPAADAVIIDTTSLDIDEVFNKVLGLVREKLLI